ncbi:MAG: HAMP domain-containing histidine kinase [Massilia sp.]|nr:HAMP domain-containing histidine kinase [Massilia sp.]
MFRKRPSVIMQLLLGYGVLLATSCLALSTIFYMGTIGVLNRSTDGKIASISSRLAEHFQLHGSASLAGLIEHELGDGADSDSEIFLAVAGSGAIIAGNLAALPDTASALGELTTSDIVRDGSAHRARLLKTRLADGGVLMVGRDLGEQEAIATLVWQALAAGGGLAILLGIAGALLFQNQLTRRIADIRLTAKAIEAGDLSRRIPVFGDDEFGLLNRDINRMLDRIEQLMNGVRHVSNAIAHDLRTPLGRVRSKLDDALRSDATLDSLAESAQGAIVEIDELTRLFDKLLTIAEAESGMRDQQFNPVDLSQIALDMVELYDATAEACQTSLHKEPGAAVLAHGERNLLASAVASLIDNALKYAGPGASIAVRAFIDNDAATIEVRDNGPGIPAGELGRVTERFYRLDRSRSLPGNGLGLSIVSAIATYHGGTLTLASQGGLIARLALPHARAKAGTQLARAAHQ